MSKKIVWIVVLVAVLIGAGVWITRTRAPTPSARVPGGPQETEEAISHWTCPMHPHIHEDGPGECPICHMSLVPVYKEGGKAPAPEPGQGPSVVISSERQQRIGITTAPVVRRSVVKEIRTVGRVAFDPELAIAEQEYLEIAKGVPELREAGRERLRLLGMTGEEIRRLEGRGVPDPALTHPEPGGPVWVYAPLYEHEVPLVEVGQEVTVTTAGLSERLTGTIRGIDPVLDPMTRSVRARIEVPGAGGRLIPEGTLEALIEVPLGERIAIPKQAVIDTGTRQVVFVVHDGTHFQSREVRLGPEAGQDQVVFEGLSEGETIATSAAFLIDSESQLKAAVSSMEGHSH